MTLTIVADLAAQRLHIAALLVPDIGTGLIRGRVTSIEYLVGKIGVHSDDCSARAGAELFIHQTDLGMSEDGSAKSRVSVAPKPPRRHGRYKLTEPGSVDLAPLKATS